MMKYFFTAAFIFSFVLPSISFAATEECPLATDAAYRAPGSTAVWYVTENCTKKAFKNSNLFFSYFDSWDQVQVDANISSISDDQFPWMAWGPQYDPQYGAVVKTLHDPKVYFLLGHKKYWVETESAFENLGYQWDWVEDVDSRLLAKYEEGEALRDYGMHPQYTLLKYGNSPEVYRLEPHPLDHRKTVKRHVASAKVFKELGYRFDRVIELDEESYLVDSLEQALPGDDIRTIEDAYTPKIPIIPGPRKGHSANYIKYSEPVFGLSYELPKGWEVEKGLMDGTGSFSVDASYQDDTQEIEREFTLQISENVLQLDQQEGSIILKSIFDYILVTEESLGDEEVDEELEKQILEEAFSPLLEKFDVEKLDELPEEQQEAIAEMIFEPAFLVLFLGEGISTDIVSIGPYENVFMMSITVEEDNDSAGVTRLYYLYTPQHIVRVGLGTNEAPSEQFNAFVNTFFTHFSAE